MINILKGTGAGGTGAGGRRLPALIGREGDSSHNLTPPFTTSSGIQGLIRKALLPLIREGSTAKLSDYLQHTFDLRTHTSKWSFKFTTRANPSKHPVVGHFWTPRGRRYLEKEVVIFFNIRGKFCSAYPSGQVYQASNPNIPLGTYWEVWNQDYFHHLKQAMSRKAATPLNQALHPNNRLSRRDENLSRTQKKRNIFRRKGDREKASQETRSAATMYQEFRNSQNNTAEQKKTKWIRLNGNDTAHLRKKSLYTWYLYAQGIIRLLDLATKALHLGTASLTPEECRELGFTPSSTHQRSGPQTSTGIRGGRKRRLPSGSSSCGDTTDESAGLSSRDSQSCWSALKTSLKDR